MQYLSTLILLHAVLFLAYTRRNVDMALIDRVKETSKKKGLSLTELAIKAGIGEKSIYSWNTRMPTVATIEKVADVLHVSTDYLLGRTDEMNPTSLDDLTEPQKQVAYFIDPQATKEDIEQIKKLVEIAKLSKRRL